MNAVSLYLGTDPRALFVPTHQVPKSRLPKTPQGRHHVDGLQQIGLSLTVFALQDVESRVGFKTQWGEIAEALASDRQDPQGLYCPTRQMRIGITTNRAPCSVEDVITVGLKASEHSRVTVSERRTPSTSRR